MLTKSIMMDKVCLSFPLPLTLICGKPVLFPYKNQPALSEALAGAHE